MKVFARYDSAAANFAATRADEPALLLEGAWPDASTSPVRWSLDESINGRFAWIDAEASRLAARLEGASPRTSDNAAYIHALPLRYYLVRLLRPIVFFQQVLPQALRAVCELFATPGRDGDYALLLAELARSEGFELHVHWNGGAEPPAAADRQSSPSAQNTRWRDWGGKLAGCFDRFLTVRGERSAPRVILCGNTRLLAPVCQDLVARRINVAWLYEQFAFRTWLRWSGTGVGQLVCHADRGQVSAAHVASRSSTELSTQGVSIGPLVDRWLASQSAATGQRWSGFQTRLRELLKTSATAGLVLDQDATPLARAAIAAARQLSIPTWVVQHGVTGVRFGFAPLAADRFLAADRASCRQLVDWGVHRERIEVTGSPSLDALRESFATQRPTPGPGKTNERRPKFLLLASTPPRDQRPDAVTFHLTSQTYDELIEIACRAVASVDGAELLVKAHPRDPRGIALRNCLARFPELSARMVEQPLAQLLHGVDVVLSCASTAGVEAAALGWPVIQLLPRGSATLLPAADYGMIGTARNFGELVALLPAALDLSLKNERIQTASGIPANPHLPHIKNQAARRIVDLVYFGGGDGGGADCGGSPFAPHRATVSINS